MKRVKFNIYFKIIVTAMITLLIMNFLVPRLLNYPPFSDELAFQIQIEMIPHTMQFLLLGLAGIIIYIIAINRIFRNIFKYIETKDKSKFSVNFIKNVRRDCLLVSRRTTITHIFLIILILVISVILMKPNGLLFLKLLLIYFSFFTFMAVVSNSFIKKDLDSIVESTYEFNRQYDDFKQTHKFYANLIFNLLPFFLVIIITIAQLGFAKASSALGEGSYYYYKIYLENAEIKYESFNELKNSLNKIPLKNENDYYFIVFNDNQYFSKSNGEISDFFIKYVNAYLEKTDGRVYEYYGIEEEAYVQKLSVANGNNIYIGFKYSTVNESIDTFFLDICITFTLIYIIVLFIWAKNISKSLVDVTNSLIYISKNKKVEDEHILPATSGDEIGELAIAFNNIQKLAKENVEKMQNEHQKLIESERLASLGQLIGGIAHNLKTPIMSISGASEGLSDLVKEYENSIDDSEVTTKDHHDIAKDMKDWIEKIKAHTVYMSDVITTVKGQAVTLSKEQAVSFDLEELVKRVEILMRHEIKKALVNFNVSINTNPNTVLYGNVVSLVQVINNMISNSIQAYNGETNKDIDLIIFKEKDDIIISIRDYGPGISKSVEDKLLKEMITTKGKNGTGLGLFMSYSNIRAHFNGNITFESKKDKGTTFNIRIPLNKP